MLHNYCFMMLLCLSVRVSGYVIMHICMNQAKWSGCKCMFVWVRQLWLLIWLCAKWLECVQFIMPIAFRNTFVSWRAPLCCLSTFWVASNTNRLWYRPSWRLVHWLIVTCTLHINYTCLVRLWFHNLLFIVISLFCIFKLMKLFSGCECWFVGYWFFTFCTWHVWNVISRIAVLMLRLKQLVLLSRSPRRSKMHKSCRTFRTCCWI